MKKRNTDQCRDFGVSIAAIDEIIKRELPAGVIVSNSVKGAFSQASSMFILYVTAAATKVAQSKNRSKVSPQDILDALSYINFDRYGGALKDTLEAYKASVEIKKEVVAPPKIEMVIEEVDLTGDD